MTAQRNSAETRRDRGFVLATVLVFLVVLSLAAFFAAGLTRANTQLVTNLRNEKQAFFVSEAGINEALYRLSLVKDSCVTITGINGGGCGGAGTAFDASIAPKTGDPVTDPFRSPWGLSVTDPLSTTQILLTTSAPSALLTNIRTPTLQPVSSSQMRYSTATSDFSPVDLTATANLTIGWDLCGADTTASHGCSPANGFYPIRGLPVAKPRPVVKVVSTGQVRRPDASVVASRKITVWANDCAPEQQQGDGSLQTTGTGCEQGITLSGSATITATGTVQVNAGASMTPDPAACPHAIRMAGSQNNITASEIDVVGQISGTATQFTPDAKEGQNYVEDPLSGMLPPCWGAVVAACQGARITNVRAGSPAGPNSTPFQAGPNAPLQPGIYYGGIKITGTGVKMYPGIYIMAGGGFSVGTGSTSVSSVGINGSTTAADKGVMIYNTSDPGVTAAGSFDLTGGNSTPSLVAPPIGQPFQGVVFYQDRSLDPQPPLLLQGGTTSTRIIDGIIYAPGADATILGNTTVSMGGSLIVQSISFFGSSGLAISNASTPPPTDPCPVGPRYNSLAWQDF